MKIVSAFDADELRDLLADVGLGNRAAFGLLYRCTHLKMLRTALHVLRDREDAEDAVQDAFLKIWRRASSYHSTETCSPISWMARIATNSALDPYRARRPRGQEVPEDLPDSRDDPEQLTITSQRDREVSRLIGHLDDKKRSIVVGAYVEGLSYKALSERMGMPLNTVRTRLRRGMQELSAMGAAATAEVTRGVAAVRPGH